MEHRFSKSKLILEDDPEEIEALSKLFDYLSEALKDAGSQRAIYAVEAAKSVMLNEFGQEEI